MLSSESGQTAKSKIGGHNRSGKAVTANFRMSINFNLSTNFVHTLKKT